MSRRFRYFVIAELDLWRIILNRTNTTPKTKIEVLNMFNVGIYPNVQQNSRCGINFVVFIFPPMSSAFIHF